MKSTKSEVDSLGSTARSTNALQNELSEESFGNVSPTRSDAESKKRINNNFESDEKAESQTDLESLTEEPEVNSKCNLNDERRNWCKESVIAYALVFF